MIRPGNFEPLDENFGMMVLTIVRELSMNRLGQDILVILWRHPSSRTGSRQIGLQDSSYSKYRKHSLQFDRTVLHLDMTAADYERLPIEAQEESGVQALGALQLLTQGA